MLQKLNKITLTWWFGHALLLTLALGVVVAAALMSPSSEALSFFGAEVPVMCGFRRITGMPCMGCGMTRSFTYMAHGQVRQAFEMNLIGPFFFAVVAAQIPWRILTLWRGKRPRSNVPHAV